MAITISTFLRGIKFPLQQGTNGNFIAEANDNDLIKSSITQILMTRRGERPMRSTYGSSVLDSIFDTADRAFADRIREEVYNSISSFEPRIIIQSVDVNIDNKPLVIVTINYVNRINNQQQSLSIDATAAK